MINKGFINKIVIILMFVLAVVTLVLTYQFIIESNNNSKSYDNLVKELEKQAALQNQIISDLESKERIQIEIWADAIKKINNPNISDEQKAVLLDVIQNTSGTIQAIVLDEFGNFSTSSSNFKNKERLIDDQNYLDSLISIMMVQNNPIKIIYETPKINSQNQTELNSDGTLKMVKTVSYIYYKNSELLDFIDAIYSDSKKLSESIVETNDSYIKSSNNLKFLPIVIFIVSLFLFLSAYYIFYYSQKSTQNKLWVGMAKETAHQIGTPLSSLIGWLNYFKEKGVQNDIINEIEKDTDRLGQIANRFSKIGSRPTPELVQLKPILNKTVEYIKKRASKNIHFDLIISDNSQYLKTNICIELFSWVLENILKNSIDSIQTDGKISISVNSTDKNIILDFIDNGKGILRSNFKNIFEPGYTSKKRGWGLGLSLSKRIIEEYHQGRIFVLKSTPFKETIIRIVLKN